VDQIPSRLAPDVVKNTSLKIAHRVVAGDDRLTLGAAMAMTERQQLALATLPRGRAAVLVDGADVPLLVQVDPVAVKTRGETVADERVRAAATVRSSTQAPGCLDECGEDAAACWAARQAVEDQCVEHTFARIVLSTLFDDAALDRLWPELQVAGDPLKPAWIDRDAYRRSLSTHAACRLAERRGAQAGWTYDATAAVSDALRGLVLAKLASADVGAALQALRAALQPLELPRSVGPFPACDRIWDGEAVPCRCRFPVTDLLLTGGFDDEWDAAVDADGAANGASKRWDVCQSAAYAVVEFPENDWPDELRASVGANAVRVALCVGQQLALAHPDAHPRSIVREIEALEDEAFA
jgi:hypothetical protein